MKRNVNIRRALFALAMVGALGFGAERVIATPNDQGPARVCDPRCKPDCDGFGGELRHWGCLCCG